MPLNATSARLRLADFALDALFIEELGWDRHRGRVEVTVDGETFTLRTLAQKRGMVALLLESADSQVPDYAMRRKIERQVARSVHEHLIVYTDGQRSTQVWQWVGRDSDRTTPREHIYQRGQSGEALIEKLDRLAFTLDEEADLTIVDVTQSARAAFDVDRVTRRFYDRFKTEHETFLDFISGLPQQEDLEWYASVMLNRLMFAYFIQKRGFLDGDRDYLRNRLQRVQATAGPDEFLSFYRHFLLRLFHEGLGQAQSRRASDLDALLGSVPYLNGGLFDVHELERAYPQIQIPDEAFERLFDFLDSYQWHLDDRPLRADNEVNPDVLGYIFEKYVNQKQMGAYYTKEDITDYITSNTVIPRLFEKLLGASSEFSLQTVARLLAADPDRYIHPPVRHGVELELPAEIAAGLDDPAAREDWSAFAPTTIGLPTETWREVVARRWRYAQVKDRLATGDVGDTSELVALNLDLRRLAEDIVEGCDSPALLLSIYRVLESLSVLDPTCGSGAFLFAALNILEPLYDATLERMEAFVVDREAAGPEKAEFAAAIERVRAHPNRTFFILKTIVVNNLYGVDIMEEAVEICKLRLFLRLVSQVDTVERLEPLPDIDFNVRAGNTLVGFTNYTEVETALAERLDVGESADQVRQRAEEAEALFQAFHEVQTDAGADEGQIAELKNGLREALAGLETELSEYLSVQYGVRPQAPAERTAWRESHRPFHWLIDFHRIVGGGGFDAIIGNPPYVEYRKVRDDYTVQGLRTERCGDLYAFVMERSSRLLARSGWFGMIVPVSVASADGFEELRRVLNESFQTSWLLNFAERPSKLFTGVEKRLTIWLGHRGDGSRETFVSKYRRWFAEERPFLFATATFVKRDSRSELVGSAIPKVSRPRELEILTKLSGHRPVASFLQRTAGHIIYYTRKLRYFVLFFDFVPGIRDAEGNELEPTELKELRVGSERERDCLLAVLNSNLFFWFFSVFSDVRNVNRREILAFRCSLDEVSDATANQLRRLSGELMEDLDGKARWLTNNYGEAGVLTIQSFQPRASKPMIDAIDRHLADHYGLTDEDVDFLTNFDVKYRMGADE